jgi:hypothetical protein
MRDQESMDKWLFRANARRKMLFGVHEACYKQEPGHSHLRYVSVGAAKAQVKGNIEVLRLMQTPEFRAHLDKLNREAYAYYSKYKRFK